MNELSMLFLGLSIGLFFNLALVIPLVVVCLRYGHKAGRDDAHLEHESEGGVGDLSTPDEDDDEPDVWVDVPDDAPPYEDPPTLREVPAARPVPKPTVGQSSAPRHALHDSPSVARQAHAGREQARQAIDARSPWTEPPSWPSDMDVEERLSIAADSHFERTADAASGTEDPR